MNWIFSLADPLTEAQTAALEVALASFVASWTAHKIPVDGTFTIVNPQVIVLSAPDGTTSGCSVDAMRKAVLSALADLGLTPLENGFVLCKPENAPALVPFHFSTIEDALQAGVLTPQTPVFDAVWLSSTPGALPADAHRPLEKTWLARFCPATTP